MSEENQAAPEAPSEKKKTWSNRLTRNQWRAVAGVIVLAVTLLRQPLLDMIDNGMNHDSYTLTKAQVDAGFTETYARLSSTKGGYVREHVASRMWDQHDYKVWPDCSSGKYYSSWCLTVIPLQNCTGVGIKWSGYGGPNGDNKEFDKTLLVAPKGGDTATYKAGKPFDVALETNDKVAQFASVDHIYCTG